MKHFSTILLLFLTLLQSCGQKTNNTTTTESASGTIEKTSKDAKLIPFRKEDKWGYCNSDKKIVIPCEYDEAYPFYEGLAMVRSEKGYGFINPKGELVIDCQYEWAHSVYHGLIYVESSSEEWGNVGALLNTEGDTVVPFRIEMPPVPLPRQERYIFSEGLMGIPWLIKPFEESLYGFIDQSGKFVIEPKVNYARPFGDGLSAVNLTAYDKVGLINKKGDIVFQADYYDIGDFKEGRARVRKDEKMGFIDKTGKVVIPIQYYTFNNFSEGLVSVVKDEKYGYLDKDGKEVIPFIYDNAFDFKEGLALVVKDKKAGFIDKKGETVIPFEFEFQKESLIGFNLAGIQHFDHGFCAVWKNGKLGFINRRGEVVVGFNYDSLGDYYEIDLSTGLVLLRQGDQYFYIDMEGNEYYEN